MDDWMRLHVHARLHRGRYTDATLVAESGAADATLVAYEANRDGTTALIAFGFERLDDGEVMTTGTVVLPYPDASAQQGARDPADPWLVMGGWGDLDPDKQVIVGKLRDPKVTRCTAVTPVSATPLPVSRGVVVGWVEAARIVLYDVG